MSLSNDDIGIPNRSSTNLVFPSIKDIIDIVLHGGISCPSTYGETFVVLPYSFLYLLLTD